MNGYTYEYDAQMSVLIRMGREESPKIMRKSDPVWRSFGPQDDPYMRAIFLGQGCWERLDSISEDRARRIMEAWGAEGQDAIPDKY